MRIATGKLFARHNDGFTELWVMGEDGVRPARPSDFRPDADTIRETGDLRFADGLGSGETAPVPSDAAQIVSPFALAAHLDGEAQRLAADPKTASEAVVLVGLSAIGRRRGSLAEVLAAVLGREN